MLRQYRNINRFPIGYPFRVPLRVSTNPGRTNLPQVPLGFRGERFSLSFRLLMPAFSLVSRPAALTGLPSPYNTMLLYQQFPVPQLRRIALAPLHLRRGESRLVSCYALF